MKEVNLDNLIEIITLFSVPNAQIEPETKLIKDGLIDSLNVMQIISELEGQYSIRIGAMDLSFDDFDTPNSLKKALDSL